MGAPYIYDISRLRVKGNGLDLPGTGGRPVVEFYKHGDETSDYMKCGIFPH
jgi:hypothetical protein